MYLFTSFTTVTFQSACNTMTKAEPVSRPCCFLQGCSSQPAGVLVNRAIVLLPGACKQGAGLSFTSYHLLIHCADSFCSVPCLPIQLKLSRHSAFSVFIVTTYFSSDFNRRHLPHLRCFDKRIFLTRLL